MGAEDVIMEKIRRVNMAGTVTHLVIADMMLEWFPITNPALFYCGNLAPDAIMARKNYVREMKKHTHFKDGIPTNDLHLEENFRLYRRRLETFAKRFLDKTAEHYELYLGYVTHMLADEVFILKVRDRYVQQLLAKGEDTHNPAYFMQFGRDVDLNDWRLVREYRFRYPMPDILLEEQHYEIEDYITCAELQKSKAFIIEKNFSRQHEEEETAVFHYEENLQYIEETVDFLKAVLHS